jgi:hypothetical protein
VKKVALPSERVQDVTGCGSSRLMTMTSVTIGSDIFQLTHQTPPMEELQVSVFIPDHSAPTMRSMVEEPRTVLLLTNINNRFTFSHRSISRK